MKLKKKDLCREVIAVLIDGIKNQSKCVIQGVSMNDVTKGGRYFVIAVHKFYIKFEEEGRTYLLYKFHKALKFLSLGTLLCNF